MLLHHDHKFYFNHAKVRGLYHRSSAGQEVIFVVIDAPLTLDAIKTPLTVWELFKLPLQATDHGKIFMDC